MQSSPIQILYTHLHSPLGRLRIAASDAGLHAIEFPELKHPSAGSEAWVVGEHPLLRRAALQLGEYFDRKRRRFDLPLAPRGSAFQLGVWKLLSEIPYGETRSYAQLARALERPGASRAVGGANGRNPLPIVLPCHRVVGADGSLTGFAGGLPAKQFLLSLEAA